MAQPKVEKRTTAIDIGSWKVSALIAGRTDTGELAILGTGQRESRGVRRGFIADGAVSGYAVPQLQLLIPS